MPDITDEELTNLRAQAEAGQSAAAALEQSQTTLAAANEALIAASRAANPTIPPALIAGATPEEITTSIEAGRATVQAVLDANPPAHPASSAPPGSAPPAVPAGAPPRANTNEVPEGLRGADRIALGIEHAREAAQ